MITWPYVFKSFTKKISMVILLPPLVVYGATSLSCLQASSLEFLKGLLKKKHGSFSSTPRYLPPVQPSSSGKPDAQKLQGLHLLSLKRNFPFPVFQDASVDPQPITYTPRMPSSLSLATHRTLQPCLPHLSVPLIEIPSPPIDQIQKTNPMHPHKLQPKEQNPAFIQSSSGTVKNMEESDLLSFSQQASDEVGQLTEVISQDDGLSSITENEILQPTISLSLLPPIFITEGTPQQFLEAPLILIQESAYQETMHHKEDSIPLFHKSSEKITPLKEHSISMGDIQPHSLIKKIQETVPKCLIHAQDYLPPIGLYQQPDRRPIKVIIDRNCLEMGLSLAGFSLATFPPPPEEPITMPLFSFPETHEASPDFFMSRHFYSSRKEQILAKKRDKYMQDFDPSLKSSRRRNHKIDHVIEMDILN